jgi:hypothetical protein
MTHNSGTVNITCSHLDPAVAAQIVEIVKQISTLNKKAATDRNQKLILSTLHEINSSLRTAVSGVQVNAPISQISTGDCSPNIVGQGNTNLCAPKAISISPEQSKMIASLLAGMNQNGRRIVIAYEWSTPNGEVIAEALRQALVSAGLDVQPLQGAGNYFPPCFSGEITPGLSFYCVRGDDDALVRAIGTALLRANVIRPPVNATRAAKDTDPLTIMIRKP